MSTTTRNRVFRSIDRGATAPAPLLATPAARREVMADAVFAAVLALQAQLAHPDAEVVREAAGMILDFEKTRLRHGQPVAGTEEPHQFFAASEASGANTAPEGRGEEPVAEGQDADDFDQYVERVRRDLEGMKGTNGIPEVITRAFAEEVARHAADLRRENVECPTNAPPMTKERQGW